MNIVQPKVEIWKQDDGIDGMWSHIARCTRVCYQSERRKNKDETDEEFVKRVILRHKPDHSAANHLAMLEHGTVYLTIPNDTQKNLIFVDVLTHDPYTKCKLEHTGEYNVINYHITTNLRVLITHGIIGALKFITKLTEYHYRRVSVCFTTNIGVSREFNRHRVNSISEESTRYCNYENNLQVCPPVWLTSEQDELSKVPIDGFARDMIVNRVDNLWEAWDYYWFAMKAAEYAYNNLIRVGWTRQQAREVLPLATKTQLIHTAFIDDWKHFLKLRADGISGAPHPNAKVLGIRLQKLFETNGYI